VLDREVEDHHVDEEVDDVLGTYTDGTEVTRAVLRNPGGRANVDLDRGGPMSVELNHTIVHVRDRWAAARDVGELLGVPEAEAYGPFAELKLDNGASLDFMDTDGEVHAQHYAFLVGEDDFDLVLGRLKAAGRTWWADPHQRRPKEINHGDGGRGLYWEGPDGHWLEIITRPYGSGG